METLLFLLKFLTYVVPILSQTVQEDDTASFLPATAESHKHPHCDCYLVSGQDQGYFQHYQFWDFRHAPIPRDVTPIKQEAPTNTVFRDGSIDNDVSEKTEVMTDSVFGAKALPLSSSEFAADWKTQNWHRRPSSRKTVPMFNSIHNIFFAQDPHPGGDHGSGNTYLVLRTTRHDEYTSAAELENRLTNVFRCSLRIRLRILPYGNLPNKSGSEEEGWNHTDVDTTNFLTPGGPPKGACAGVFTINPTGGESDIEILTKDPSNIVHYANQPDYDPVTDESIPGASTIAAVRTPWTEWSTHRLDWFSNLSVWYVDSRMEASKTYKVPDMPSTLVVNLWSDGGDWTGDMKVGESAFMGVEWIQLAYNVSGPQTRDDPDDWEEEDDSRKKKRDDDEHPEDDKRCRRPCWLDDVR